jgi:putative ABC transport system permease protein
VTRLFTLVLRLLPRHRRDRYGDEMRDVFAALAADARQHRGGPAALLMKELGGLMRFAWRDRLSRVTDWQPAGGGWHPLRELHWAWRGVRGRGLRAALVVVLVALALAGNALIFAVADALVFNRVPYPSADRIVEIHTVGTPDEPMGDRFFSAALLDAWRKQTDLFSSVQGYLTKNVFVVSDGRSEIAATTDVTPGLIALLGATPAWGRSLTVTDARETAVLPSLLSARLARQLFGRPQDAVGKTVETTAYPLLVVGVMADDFAFPRSRNDIWRVMDPRGPLTENSSGVQSIARIAPGVSMEGLRSQMRQRSESIGAAAGAGSGYLAVPGPFHMSSMAGLDRARTMFLVLLGGALCLLLTACANVASVELAGALRRSRTSAVQMALGASRAMLARIAFLEGALLLGVAFACGTGLAWLATHALDTLLPERMATLTANPIDIDARVLLFMTTIAAVGWLLTSLPSVLFASRTTLLHLLKSEDRSASLSRSGVFVRRGLTVFEVAVAVLLVTSATMYTRSYVALLSVDKGFDASNLVELSFTIPVEYYSGAGESRVFADDVMARVRGVPGVLSAMPGSPPPSTGNSPFGGVSISVDGQPPGEETFRIGEHNVPSEFLDVTRVPVRAGRWFEPHEPPSQVVIPEQLARRLWPSGQAVGQSFRLLFRSARQQPTLHVIGVVGDFRTSRPDIVSNREPDYFYYTLRQPPPPTPPETAPAKPRPLSAGGSWRFFDVTARLDSPKHAGQLLEAARTVDRRLRVTLESVDDRYAGMFSDVLLATRVTNAFGVLAFVVAVVGVYGVMSYLVAGRRREIGIRMALGADRRDVRRLVLSSALTLVVIGTLLGVAGALGVARWSASQFFGVSAMDPLTYVSVAALILVTAVIATWQPARSASRIDPAVTLRAE